TRNDADLLNMALLDPVEELIRFLQQSSRRHRAFGPAMPTPISLLLLDRLLKHGPQPTISVTHRRSWTCGIAKGAPSIGLRNEVYLTVESPLLPLLPNAVSHHQQSHVAIRALVQVVGPCFEHGHVCHLHVED